MFISRALHGQLALIQNMNYVCLPPLLRIYAQSWPSVYSIDFTLCLVGISITNRKCCGYQVPVP